ncbi:MAG: hypothetical protein H7144_14595 [Burkholderiales bacterium]|nr:hypothetical protein [Phycisphaerae bacterium]
MYGSLILSIDLGKGQATPATNDHIEEGHYYYTFFVCRPGVLGLWHRYAGPVQFEKTVPSLDWRQQQVAKHHEMNSTVRKEEYDAIQHANRMTEAERKRDSLRDKKHTDPEKEHAVQKARDRQRRADRDQRFETDLETLRNSARYKNAPKAEQLALERTLRYDHSLREEDDLKP